jgi:hypothetical protein
MPKIVTLILIWHRHKPIDLIDAVSTETCIVHKLRNRQNYTNSDS